MNKKNLLASLLLASTLVGCSKSDGSNGINTASKEYSGAYTVTSYDDPNDVYAGGIQPEVSRLMLYPWGSGTETDQDGSTHSFHWKVITAVGKFPNTHKGYGLGPLEAKTTLELDFGGGSDYYGLEEWTPNGIKAVMVTNSPQEVLLDRASLHITETLRSVFHI